MPGMRTSSARSSGRGTMDQKPLAQYGITVLELRKLLETPKENAIVMLREDFGGVAGIGKNLHVDLDQGLTSDDDFAGREAVFGSNYIPPPKSKSLWELMLDASEDLTIRALAVFGTISIILGATAGKHPEVDWIEGMAILVAVAVVIVVAAFNDYQKEKQFRSLNAVKEDEGISIYRDGNISKVSKFKIVVGDIMKLETGDIIPADAIFISGNDLKVDESSLTGETDLVSKSTEKDPFFLSGTKVMSGIARVLIVAVGSNSQAGIIQTLIRGKTREEIKEEKREAKRKAKEAAEAGDVEVALNPEEKVEEEDEKDQGADPDEFTSPLQVKLDKLTLFITKLGLFASVATLVVLILRFVIETYAISDDPHPSGTEVTRTIVDYFVIAITILVVAIPEGLPLAVTIALAFSVRKMLADMNLVRHLAACETMGSATTVCSDKTGTLTTNRMTVMKLWAGNTFCLPQLPPELTSENFSDIFRKSVALNSTANISPPKEQFGLPEHLGNKTECALLQYVNDMGGPDYKDVRAASEVLRMFTFSSARKRMSIIVNDRDQLYTFTKGASEIVLKQCSTMLNLDGSVVPLTDKIRQTVMSDVITNFAYDGFRTLTIAYKKLPAGTSATEISEEEAESDLTLIAVAAIEDPVRPEVPEAIQKCARAGITVRMVTGDNIDTARAIAKKCGILSTEDTRQLVMEGPVFRSRVLNSKGEIVQSEFDRIWPHLKVLARSSPQDKHTLVTGIMASNTKEYGRQVVAVTGDGTNDAPALRKANVGFSMGISGTSVAKDASDIILMDDNFASIVKAVKWGRNTYDAISKFLQFQLTVNLTAITTAVTCSMIIEDSIFKPVQLLWINLIMDSFASLALATELPTEALLERRPYPVTKPLISKRMAKHIIGQSAYQLAVIYVMVFAGKDLFNLSDEEDGRSAENADKPTVHYTLIYNMFVQMTLFNEINARRIHDELNVFENLHKNPLFIGIFIFQHVAQAFIVQFGGYAFGCDPLSAEQWGICLLVGFMSLPIGFALRFIRGSRLPSWLKFCRADMEDVRPPATYGKQLWIRGLKRLRTQIRVVKAFQSTLPDFEHYKIEIPAAKRKQMP